MSLSNQAFVKSYARGRRGESQPAADPTVPPSSAIPPVNQPAAAAEPAATDHEPVLQLVRHDGPATVPSPHRSPAITPANDPESSSDQPSVDETLAESTTDVVMPPVAPTADSNRIEAASASDALQHIHTAYAACTWQDWLAPSQVVVDTATESQPVESQPAKTQTEPTESPSESPTEAGESSLEAIIESLRIDAPEGETAGPHLKGSAATTESTNHANQSQPDVLKGSVSKAGESKTSETKSDPKIHQDVANQAVAAPRLPFRAAWEVDVFDVPVIVADLFFEGKLFQQIAQQMNDAVETGLRTILVTSTQRGEGRSSVAIGIAMAAAAANIRVALVDADSAKPTLADDLRLELEFGWVDALRGKLPLKEIAVHAVEDGVTLLPLMTPGRANAATSAEIADVIGQLRDEFELVIVDGPCGLSPSINGTAAAVDTSLVVRDMDRTNAASINDLCHRLRDCGVKGAGIVENFVTR